MIARSTSMSHRHSLAEGARVGGERLSPPASLLAIAGLSASLWWAAGVLMNAVLF